MRLTPADIDAFGKVLDLRDEGNLTEALSALSKIIEERKPCALHAHIMRGQILLYDLENLKGAEHDLRKALMLKPDAKRASYYLHTVLLEQGRIEEAIEEGRRFFSQLKCAISPDDELLRDYQREINALTSFRPEVIEDIRNRFLTNGFGSDSGESEPEGNP